MSAAAGGPLSTYEVEINGVSTSLRLTDADAEARGLKPVAKAKAPAANKAAKAPANKAASSRRDEIAGKAFGGKSKQAAAEGDG